mgnify:CR=1 FL=1
MIPSFPQFKNLEVSDRSAIESYTKSFPPYSDYSFASMWLWDHNSDTVISDLNGNLVVQLCDIRSGESFYSFIGTTDCDNVAEQLLEHLASQSLTPELKLIPEVSAQKLDHTRFEVSEDRDMFDYIQCTKQLALMLGSGFEGHRRNIRKFPKQDAEFRELDLSDATNQAKLRDCVACWTELKNNHGRPREDWEIRCFEAEQISFQRMFQSQDLLEAMTCSGLFVNGVLAGFSVGEIIHDHFLLHFHKSDYKHIGTIEFLFQQLAILLLKREIHFLNDEEDLGLPGLRLNKSRYRPVNFLKKYTVRRIQ